MTYDLRVERLIDASPEVVFDTIVDPDAQAEIFADPVYDSELLELTIDLRVGGTWNIVFGSTGKVNRITNVFTEVDRPRRLSYRVSTDLAGWSRTVENTETITLEERDGKTLLALTEGFEDEADRDAWEPSVPNYVDALERVVRRRTDATRRAK